MSKRRDRSNAAPEVEPLDVDGVRTVAVVTVAWAAALIVLAFFREQLVAEGQGWWLWTCLAGVGLGLMALEYTRKRRDSILDAKRRAAAALEVDGDEYDETDDGAAAQIGPSDDHKVTGPIATSVHHTGEQPTGPIVAGAHHTGEHPTAMFASAGDDSGHGDARTWSTDHGDTDLGHVVRGDTGHVGTDHGDTDHGDTDHGDTDHGDTDTDHGRASRRGGRQKSRKNKERGQRLDDHAAPVEVSVDDTPMTTTSSGQWYVGAAPVEPEPAPTPRSAHHVAETEFDTDVRAWLNMSDDEAADPGLSATNTDTHVTRPVPVSSTRSGRPPVGRAGGLPGPSSRPAPPTRSTPSEAAPRPVPTTPVARGRADTGELPPSTPRSAPYPGDIRPQPAAQPQRPEPQRPEPQRPEPQLGEPQPAEPTVSGPTSSGARPPAPLPRRDRSAGAVDSEFFEPIRPSSRAAAEVDNDDDDLPLLETTLGGGRRRRQAPEQDQHGHTGTEGSYRGRRARRSDSA